MPPPSSSYSQALARLARLRSNRAVTSLVAASADTLNARSLPEMSAWLARAGPPAATDLARMRCVHVAGTKGKGSVCALVGAVLRGEEEEKAEECEGGLGGTLGPARGVAAGRVGVYGSPHVVSVRERIALDGEPISRDAFAGYFSEVWDALAASRGPRHSSGCGDGEEEPDMPGFFQFMTILAFHVFLRERVGSAVVECGIGGEFDSTNVLPREAVSVAVVTRLGVDHVGMLGRTAEEIAWHKAGIFRPGIAAVTGRVDGPVGEVLRRRARERGARLVEVRDGDVERWSGGGGGYRARNRALAAVACMEHLGVPYAPQDPLRSVPARFVSAMDREEMRRGRGGGALRGRGEVLKRRGAGGGAGAVRWFLDGAHTDDSLREVGAWFHAGGGRAGGAVLVFNQQERDVGALLAALVEGGGAAGSSGSFAHAVFTRNERRPGGGSTAVQERAAAVMRQLCGGGVETVVADGVGQAVQEAERRAGPGGAVLATGSFHLVGAVIREVEGLADEEDL